MSLVWTGTSNEEDDDGLPAPEGTRHAPRSPEHALRDTFTATFKTLAEQTQLLGSRLRGFLKWRWRS